MNRIQAVEAKDMARVAEIYNLSRAPVACFGDRTIVVEEMIRLTQGERIYLAFHSGDDIAAGFISVWRGDNAFIHHLYTAPEFQGRGIASELLAFCIDTYGLPVSLKSVEKNTHACRFYETYGFRSESTAIGEEGRYHYYWLRRVPVSDGLGSRGSSCQIKPA